MRRSELNLLPPNCGIAGLTPRLAEKCIHKTYQITDEDGPALPPDFVDGEDLSTRFDCNRLTGLYRRAYCTSNSARRGCRHYARGFLHKNIDPKTTFVIDPTRCAEMDLLVEVHIRHSSRKLALRRHSVVQIRYLPTVVGEGCGALLQDINNHCNAVRQKTMVAQELERATWAKCIQLVHASTHLETRFPTVPPWMHPLSAFCQRQLWHHRNWLRSLFLVC